MSTTKYTHSAQLNTICAYLRTGDANNLGPHACLPPHQMVIESQVLSIYGIDSAAQKICQYHNPKSHTSSIWHIPSCTKHKNYSTWIRSKIQNADEQIYEGTLASGRRLRLTVIPLPLGLASTMVQRMALRFRLAQRIRQQWCRGLCSGSG